MNQLSQHEITAYLGRFQAPLQTAEEIAERDQMDSCSAIAQMAVLMSAEHKDQLRAVSVNILCTCRRLCTTCTLPTKSTKRVL